MSNRLQGMPMRWRRMSNRLQVYADALEAYEAKSREIVEKLDNIVTRMEIRQKRLQELCNRLQ